MEERLDLISQKMQFRCRNMQGQSHIEEGVLRSAHEVGVA